MKKHILIVDDERLILFGLTEALKTESVEIRTASTAASTLKEVKAFPDFDLFIIDLTLPDINGLDLAKTIKKDHPSAKFIFMSGKYRDKEDFINNIEGADDIHPCEFITKPFDFDTTQELVFQALEK
ncbi:MAG: response regulator [Desulfobulbaceae bacterium]|uniref:Response regulator n=1 Tax=Candidatus Desulfobia pelagia TaxID=2841692 RepID=A0A8J6NCW2_9BACT|nr:response regulator [Candidatus Desulfobia pelagia]